MHPRGGGFSMDRTQDTMTSMARGSGHAQTIQTSKTWTSKRFSFLKSLNIKEQNKGSEALESRQNR